MNDWIDAHPLRVEVLSIGHELLDGRVADTNTVRLAARLKERGMSVAQRTTVADDIEVIVREAAAIASRGTHLCVVCGGLGPTADDLTAAAFARLVGVPLIRDEQAIETIRTWLERRGRPLTENQLKQADRPSGSQTLSNPCGTAPGFALAYQGCHFVSVPGIPSEFDAMVESAVLQPLAARSITVPDRRLFCCFGLVEGDIDQRLAALPQQWPLIRLGFRVKFPEIHVTLDASAGAGEQLQEASDWVRSQLGDHVFAEEPVSLAETIVAGLAARGETLAVAESCTGGLITDLLTDIAGSSAILRAGVVAYSNDAKQSLLGVSAATLQTHGAVSEATAQEMARGVRERCGADWSVATTGIAGPGGGNSDKPVGTIWIACVGPGMSVPQSRRLNLPFERRGNKLVGAHSALDLMRRTWRIGQG